MLQFVYLSYIYQRSGITYPIIYIFLNCIDTLWGHKIPENLVTK